jgi:hypothetical protein
MTFRAKLTSVWIFFAAFLLTPSLTWAQGLVQGIVDKMFYDNRAAFIIPTQAGFEYSATLNGAPIPVGVSNYVTRADYYELQVRRTETASGSVTDQLVRFLVVARAERGTSERGLPSWTPYPLIHCATGELAAAELHIVAPKTFPLGLEIPVIGILRTSDSRPVRANGLVTSANFPEVTLQLRRGWGSAFLPPASSSGPLVYDAQLHSLQTNKQIAIEAETTWTTVGGTLSSSATWPANSRIHVASHLLVTTGNSLTIEQGTVVRLAAGVEIRVNGQLFVNGTTECPVVFTPTNRAAPWGGIVLRTNAPRATITGAIFTRSGASATWMSDNNGGSTHRSEQPLIYLGNGAQATLTDCYAVDHRGQFGHGETATLRMTRTLVQKFTTGGQFNSGSVRLDQCAIIEIPSDDDVFADDDNDAFYLTGGNHSFTNCLVGWAKDDGLDAGSGAGGSVAVIGCWFESCYHEGMAWSTDTGTRNVTVRDTVVLNCGQGIEAGFGDPEVFADHCVSIGNLSGARFGDNYDWSYSGFLRVTNSFLLHNYRNIFGRTWAPGAWTNELDQMDLRNNYLSAADTNHPNNFLWQPDQDGWRLAALMSTPPDRPVGVGFARRTGQASRNSVSNGLVVGLSSFTTNCVAVDYAVETPDGTLANGTLEFTPGEIVKTVPLQVSDPQSHEFIRVALHNPAWAELSGITRFYFMDVSATPPQTLIAAGWIILTALGAREPRRWAMVILASRRSVATVWTAPASRPPTSGGCSTSPIRAASSG